MNFDKTFFSFTILEQTCFFLININSKSGFASHCPKNNSIYFINSDNDGSIKDCNDGTQICRSGVMRVFLKNNRDLSLFSCLN